VGKQENSTFLYAKGSAVGRRKALKGGNSLQRSERGAPMGGRLSSSWVIHQKDWNTYASLSPGAGGTTGEGNSPNQRIKGESRAPRGRTSGSMPGGSLVSTRCGAEPATEAEQILGKASTFRPEKESQDENNQGSTGLRSDLRRPTTWTNQHPADKGFFAVLSSA